MVKRRKINKGKNNRKGRKGYELNEFVFGIEYFSKYRYFRALMNKIDREHIDEYFSDLSNDQKDSLQLMFELELLINALQYCSDLASILISLSKEKQSLMITLSSLHETGSGSIKEFFEIIPNKSIDYFWNLCGYNKIRIPDKELDRYKQSSERFRNDIIKISEYYLKWSSLYMAYKHGLRLFIRRNISNNQKMIFEVHYDGTFNIRVVTENWFLIAIEITEIIQYMFDSIVSPQLCDIPIIKELGNNVDEKEVRIFKKSKDIPEGYGKYEFNIQWKNPWRRGTKFQKPFY